MEIWKDVPNEAGYCVSNRGRVKSKERLIMRNNGRPQRIRERILKVSPDEWGYPQVRLNGHTYKVHRLVALAFLSVRDENAEIRHLDGNPMNNHIANLVYGTHSQNVLDGYSYRGYIRKGQKLTIYDVKKIKTMLNEGTAARIIASIFNVSEQTICDIKHHRIYNHVEVINDQI